MTIGGFGYNLLYSDFDLVDCTDRVLQSLSFPPMTVKQKSLAIYVCRGEVMLDVPNFCAYFSPLTSLFNDRPVYECEVMAAFIGRGPPIPPDNTPPTRVFDFTFDFTFN